MQAAEFRVATWAGDFSRKGPGLLLKDLLKPDRVPGEETLLSARADVLLLTDFDYDAGLVALSALQERLAKDGLSYPYLFAAKPNTGLPTGLDLDGDDRLGGPRDAQGFGWFSGQGGQAILSRWPVSLSRDYSNFLWQDLPDHIMPPNDPGREVQRLSSTAHWMIEVAHPDGALNLLTIAATPPVFDGPEDRNGRRNHDEVKLWRDVLQGSYDHPPEGPAILLGKLNVDPHRGDGRGEIVQDLLAMEQEKKKKRSCLWLIFATTISLNQLAEH